MAQKTPNMQAVFDKPQSQSTPIKTFNAVQKEWWLNIDYVENSRIPASRELKQASRSIAEKR